MQKSECYTVTSLLKSEIRSERIIIENVIKGNTVSLLSADPKLGKTAIALQLADAVSKGDIVFDQKTNKNKVLYIFLDDSAENVKDRMSKMNIIINEDFYILFVRNSTINDIQTFLIELNNSIKEKIGFVIIDMLNDVRSIDSSKEYSNVEIKKDINSFRKIASENEVAILLLHHNRKEDSANKNNRALGGVQLTGSINGSLLSLIRKNAQEKEAVLEISGRNIRSTSINLEWNDSSVCFSVHGEVSNPLDPELVKIINFITKNVSFSGTVQQLCSEVKILTDPRIIGKALSNCEIDLLQNGILTKKRKSNGVRIIHLELLPEYQGASGTSELHLKIDGPNDPNDPEKE